MTCSPTSFTRRVFDLLVIVAIAAGLLGLAWWVARDRGRKGAAPLATSVPDTPGPETPELQLLLPLEKFGMVLTREHVDGRAEQAVTALDQRCRKVLAAADEWVLSLAVSPEEQQLLDSLDQVEPLPGPPGSFASSAQLFPLHRPTGRAGVRQSAVEGALLAPALIPTIKPSLAVEPSAGEREQLEPAPAKEESASAAPAGRRLICWGFIVSDGAEGHTVWFARPRDKLPRSVSQKGHAP